MVKMTQKKKILVAPLDWGLGHATRSYSLIHFLLSQNCAIVLACTPNQEKIFEQLRQKIQLLPLHSYKIKYSKSKWWLPFALAMQIPKIKKAINKENTWLQKIVTKEQIDLVISDNRFGLYTKKVPCIFITHQLTIKAPFSWAENWLQKVNYSFINRFTQVWIPDNKGTNALAGVLSNPTKLPKIPVHYIGHLNRFFIEGVDEVDDNSLVNDIKLDVLVMLSGPEPQRSLLEDEIWRQISQMPHLQFVVLRGLPQNTLVHLPQTVNAKLYNHLPQKIIKQLISKANFIIARSGYTTIMEVLSMHKECIFIPTPGQTEQEYLANYLHEKQFCISARQSQFNLKNMLHKAETFQFKTHQTHHSYSVLQTALTQLNIL